MILEVKTFSVQVKCSCGRTHPVTTLGWRCECGNYHEIQFEDKEFKPNANAERVQFRCQKCKIVHAYDIMTPPPDVKTAPELIHCDCGLSYKIHVNKDFTTTPVVVGVNIPTNPDRLPALDTRR